MKGKGFTGNFLGGAEKREGVIWLGEEGGRSSAKRQEGGKSEKSNIIIGASHKEGRLNQRLTRLKRGITVGDIEEKVGLRFPQRLRKFSALKRRKEKVEYS